MGIDTKVGAVEYINLVEQIADGFIAENGDYIPHAGHLNAMEIFYKRFYCRDETPKSIVDDPSALDDVFGDEEFIAAYNAALDGDGYGTGVRLDFSNAYTDAMQIVEDRSNSLNRGVNMVVKFIEKYFTPDNMAKIFGDSNRFQEIIGSDADNVVSFVGQVIKKE